jgi:prepilin-type N-terminal cleavage/methylation domain-containing protein
MQKVKNRFKDQRERKDAFALIELIVAVAVLSFLISLSAFIYLHTLKVVESGRKRNFLESGAQVALNRIVNEISQSKLIIGKTEVVTIGVFEQTGNEKIRIAGKGKYLRPVYEENPVTYKRNAGEILRNGKPVLISGIRARTLQFNYWGYDPRRSKDRRLSFSGLDRNRDGEISGGEEHLVSGIQVIMEVSKDSESVFVQTSKRINPVLGEAVVKKKYRNSR